ncbi:hypothetical protein AAZX31_02G061900 [Glycine max]|uniref:Uncharacterized protein n=1 Tax=Glycine soja TaxID=3848 RepID=A0A445LKQ2_GLYSO|nr:hypothetical protein D0Y65_003153 [Glycine soja]
MSNFQRISHESHPPPGYGSPYPPPQPGYPSAPPHEGYPPPPPPHGYGGYPPPQPPQRPPYDSYQGYFDNGHPPPPPPPHYHYQHVDHHHHHEEPGCFSFLRGWYVCFFHLFIRINLCTYILKLIFLVLLFFLEFMILGEG